MGRVVILEVIVHVTVWIVAEVAGADWSGVVFKIQTSLFLQCGVASALAMILLLLLSPSVIRHAFYKAFLNAYILFAVVTFVGA